MDEKQDPTVDVCPRCKSKHISLNAALDVYADDFYMHTCQNCYNQFNATEEDNVNNLEIRRNNDESLDEIVARNVSTVHLEQMGTNHWHLSIYVDGATVRVDILGSGGVEAIARTQAA